MPTISVLTADEVLLAKNLVHIHLADGISSKRCKCARKKLAITIQQSGKCSNEATDSMIDTLHASAVCAAQSVRTATTFHRAHDVWKKIALFADLSEEFTMRAAQARLTRAMRRWQDIGSHSHQLIKACSSLCKQEVLKKMHKQIKANQSISLRDRKPHTLKARLADVRAELFTDLCLMPQLADKSFPKIKIVNNDTLQSGKASEWRGMNLSGWLLWEPGPANKCPLVKSLGGDDIPKDEWTLCEKLTAKYGRAHAESLVHKHRSSHVTKEDFVAIRNLGFNAVRIPFGYWAFCPKDSEPFFGNCTAFLDSAFEWGADLGISIILCLHAAVGFQSRDPPCGRANEKWRPSQFDVEATVGIMRDVVKRYGSHNALGGICILNEPHGDLPANKLNRYFKDAYHAMRTECGLPVSVQILMPIFYHDFKHFKNTYTEGQGYQNVVFDVHCYQVMGDPYAGWRNMSLAWHLRYAAGASPKHDARCIADHGERVVVSEFSAAIPTSEYAWMIYQEYSTLKASERLLLHRCFAVRQLRTFTTHAEGFFFWSWKDDSGPAWSFSEGQNLSLLPTFCHKSDEESCEQESLICLGSSNTLRAQSVDAFAPAGKRRRLSSSPTDSSTDVGSTCDDSSEEQSERDASETIAWNV